MNDTRGSRKEARKDTKEDGAIAGTPTRCRLCLKPAPLCDSHIVPEFFFDHLYDEKHRCYSLSSIQGKPIRLLQKGVRERLLCKACEGQFSVYEQHARSVLYGGVENGGDALPVAICQSTKPKL